MNTIFGFNEDVWVRCSACNMESSVLKKGLFPYELLPKTYHCDCGNTFTFREGIIQSLISPNTFSQLEYISNIVLKGTTKIKVGYAHTIELDRSIPNVEKVFITNIDNFANVSYELIPGSNILRIISSQDETGGVQVGDTHKISWLIYGNDNQVTIPTWERLLVHAKDELIKGQYKLSVLTSVMAFESFINLLLNKLLTSKGTSDEAVNIILSSMGNIITKVRKLLPELSEIDIAAKNKDIFNDWEKLIPKRNRIAHGGNIIISQEEASSAFEIVIRAIFYISEHSPIKL